VRSRIQKSVTIEKINSKIENNNSSTIYDQLDKLFKALPETTNEKVKEKWK